MTYAADLHTQPSCARATSRKLNFENLSHWAKIKGIDLLATGDFIHPAWFAEMGQKLKDTGDGLFELDGVNRNILHTIAKETSKVITRYFPDGIQCFHKLTIVGWHNCKITP